MIPCSQDFIKAMNSPIKELYIKMEFYDSKMNLITGFEEKVSNLSNNAVPDKFTNYGTMRRIAKSKLGNISVDTTRPIRRSFNFSMGNDDGAFTWGENSLIWIDKRIKIYVGLKLADGSVEYIPQGVFVITQPEDTHNKDGKIVTVSGYDKAYLMTDKRGKFVNEMTIQKGTDVLTAIKLIASDAGETMFNFDQVSATVPYDLTYQGTDNRWNAIQDLANLAQCEVFYDVNGYLRVRYLDPNLDSYPVEWSYIYGDSTELFYAGNLRQFDETDLANYIRVVGGSSQTATVTYDLIVDEDNPYTVSNTYASVDQFNQGTFSGTVAIEDNNDGLIALAQKGTNFAYSESKQSDFQTGTLSFVTAVDDTDYTLAFPNVNGHLEPQFQYGFSEDFNSTFNYATNGTTVNSVTNGYLTVTSTSSTPTINMYNIGSFDPTVYRFIAIRYMVQSGGSPNTTVNWLSTNNTAIDTVNNSSLASLISDGQWHIVYIDMWQNANWKNGGDITGWQWQWADIANVNIQFDYIHLIADVTGVRTLQLPINQVSSVGTSQINWNGVIGSNATITIETRVSYDNGLNWSSWITASNGGIISGLGTGQNVQTSLLQIKQTLHADDPSNLPKLSEMDVSIVSAYIVGTGTYTSNKFAITSTSANPTSGSASINWSDNVPTNTTVSAKLNVSVDNGLTWSGFTTYSSGGVINQITNTVDISNCLFQVQFSLSTTDQSVSPQILDFTIQANAPIWQNSPYSVQKIGQVLYEHNNGSPDPLITQLYQAKWRAKYELMKRLGYSERVEMEIAPNWLHDGGDVIKIEDSENNVTGHYRLESFDLPIIPQLMVCRAVKHKQVINDWNAI